MASARRGARGDGGFPSRAVAGRKGFGGDRRDEDRLALSSAEEKEAAATGVAPGARYAAARGGAARGGAFARLAPKPQHPPAGGGGDGGQSSWTDPEACENTDVADRFCEGPSPGGFARGEDREGRGEGTFRAARSPRRRLGDAYSDVVYSVSCEVPPGVPGAESPGDASSFVPGDARRRASCVSSSGQK